MANKELEVNGRIRDKEIRLIDENGVQLGVMSSYEASRLADERNLDLVKISPNVVPPVCKIMDYGKYKFDLSKKEKDARKTQKQNETKEIWLSMTIDTHDLETKAKQGHKFLTGGDRVKVSIRMKGRQQAHPEFGIEVMKKYYELVADAGVKEDKGIIKEGRNIFMLLLPNKKPTVAPVKNPVQKPAEAEKVKE